MRLAVPLGILVWAVLAAAPARATLPRDAVTVAPCADDEVAPPLVLAFAPRDPDELDRLLREQLDPGSPRHHAWLTPAGFGDRFGAPAADYAAAAAWLTARGFGGVRTWPGRTAIAFGGDAGHVAAAFGTRLHHVAWHGVGRLVALDAPVLPSFGATRASALLGLDGFARVHPGLAIGGGNRLAPADVQRVFGVDRVHAAGHRGAGTTVAVIALSDFTTDDVAVFRSVFGLPATVPAKHVASGTTPPFDQTGALEALLDTEWVGATAPDAAIVAEIASGAELQSVYAAELDVVNQNQADVVNVSLGACEALIGRSAVAQFDGLARQAAAQGQTVVVASGDDGVADCRALSPSDLAPSVNGLGTSAWVTAVGGTRLDPRFDAAGDATGYGGEVVWNETAAGGGASGGGPSAFIAKPAWQQGPGVPADGARDVPDVAFASSPDDPGYIVLGDNGDAFGVGGTSAGTPIWAGLAAVLVQQHGGRIGALNPELYRLARAAAAGGPAVFHDVTIGTNAVGGTTGFSAAPGFDLATGWGSFDAPALTAAYGACTVDADCADGSECTVDRCTAAGCSNMPAADGTSCNAADPCFVDACSAGACVAGASRCDDGDACTTDTCDATGCHHDAVVGVAGVLCLFTAHPLTGDACQASRVPAGVGDAFDAARIALARAATAARAARRRHLVATAIRSLRRAERLVTRGVRRQRIDVVCATALDADIAPIRDAAQKLP